MKKDQNSAKRMLTSATYGGGLSFGREDTSVILETPRYVAAKGKFSAWTISACLLAFIVLLPLLSVVLLAFTPEENIWPHLMRTVLGSYIFNKLVLMAGVGAGTLIIGVGTAWIVTHYDFHFRNLYNWGLLLPFSVPAYVIAYVYTDLLEFAGPLQTQLRDTFGWQYASDYYFPAIRSLPGAMIMMTLVMYPYVYLLARAAFLEQSASLSEAAQSLGKSKRSSAFKVALPMARPAIAVGLSLVLMETLNDYGTVDYFAIPTLSAGLYDVWLGMGNLGGGAQIATLMLIFVMMLIGLEKTSRRHHQSFQPGASRLKPMARKKLSPAASVAMSAICFLPILLGFLVPAIVLVHLAVLYFDVSWSDRFQQIVWNSIKLSTLAALSAVSLGILLSYSKRLHPSRWMKNGVSIASLGYAIPGAVLAIGVIIPLSKIDHILNAVAQSLFNINIGLVLSGTVFALVFAYTVRFLAVAYGSINASMTKISPHMDDAARSLGHSSGKILRKVHIPLMRGGILTAALVVFVDCMKELPATLVLRPFNFDTLATNVYQFASDELIGRSALSALLIVIVGLIPVILLSTTIDKSRDTSCHDE